MINPSRQRFAAEVSAGQVIGGWRNQTGEGIVGCGEIRMGLGGGCVSGMERAVGNDTGWEASDGGAGAHPDVAVEMAGAGIGHGGSAEHGKILGGPERLCTGGNCDRHGGDT